MDPRNEDRPALEGRAPQPADRPAWNRALERRRLPDRRHSERRQLDRRANGADRPAAPPVSRTREKRRTIGLLSDVRRRVSEDHVVIVAAGVAFNFFLAIFPTLFALVSIYGLVADRSMIESHLAWLSGLLPPRALELVRGQLRAIVATSPATLRWGTAISILVALWSAAGGSAALMEALNVAHDAPERRGFVRLRATALTLSFGLVLFLLLSVTLIAAVPNVIALLHLPPSLSATTQIAQWALLVALILGVLGLLYRHAPARPVEPHRWTTAGAIAAALLWLAASALFSWYAANFGRFDKTHGALGAVVALLLWLQISCLVVLLGAELDAAIARRRAAAV